MLTAEDAADTQKLRSFGAGFTQQWLTWAPGLTTYDEKVIAEDLFGVNNMEQQAAVDVLERAGIKVSDAEADVAMPSGGETFWGATGNLLSIGVQLYAASRVLNPVIVGTGAPATAGATTRWGKSYYNFMKNGLFGSWYGSRVIGTGTAGIKYAKDITRAEKAKVIIFDTNGHERLSVPLNIYLYLYLVNGDLKNHLVIFLKRIGYLI